MLQEHQWSFYALSAAILWGIQYATIEQLLKTIPAPIITLSYGIATGITYLILFIWLQSDLGLDELKVYLTTKNLLFFGVVVLAGCISTLFIFSAIAKETATKASLIEITYPFFVALFAALIYREPTFNWQILAGGLLMLVGGGLILY